MNISYNKDSKRTYHIVIIQVLEHVQDHYLDQEIKKILLEEDEDQEVHQIEDLRQDRYHHLK